MPQLLVDIIFNPHPHIKPISKLVKALAVNGLTKYSQPDGTTLLHAYIRDKEVVDCLLWHGANVR